jgi:hypothetical protein
MHDSYSVANSQKSSKESRAEETADCLVFQTLAEPAIPIRVQKVSGWCPVVPVMNRMVPTG